MKKSFILFLFVLTQNTILHAQKSIYEFLPLGESKIGFMDTLIFDASYPYKAFDYSGPKPYFIQIWHPLKKTSKKVKYLLLNDFFKIKKNDQLNKVQEQLENNYKEIIIRDFIFENLETADTNKYGNYSHKDIFNLLLTLETRSIRQSIADSLNFPIIIYHHGSQSNSFENYAMAEYFASRGYIFIASNFHLPYENTIFGLKPFSQLIKNEEEGSITTILKFAQSLNTSQPIFFIGHSWGAQMGFRTFNQNTNIKGFVSLETTLEYKTEHDELIEMWPEVFQKIITEKANYPFPILLCAAVGKDKSFGIFEELNAQQITYASTKKEFEHNAYLTLFYLRNFITKKIPQADKAILKNRLSLYIKHLEMIHRFFERIQFAEKFEGRETRFITD